MRRISFIGAVGLLIGVAGCGNENVADAVDRLLNALDNRIQTEDQELPPVLIEEGDTIVINNDVTIIEDPHEDVVVAELPDLTLLGFENDTGWDMYLQYFADGDFQAVYVYDGEALLLEYPCLESLELISEDHIDPASGVLVESFDLTGVDFFNPDDFICGDAFILNFNPDNISGRVEVVDLVD